MATTKKRTARSVGRKKSTIQRVGLTAAAAAGGAIAGAALGKLGMAGGLGLIIAGTIQNNPMLTVAGVAAAVAPGALNSSEKSMSGGIKAQIEDARASVKKLAANLLPKTGINIIMPNAFPSLQLGEVDASYYAGGGQSAAQAEQAFNNALMAGTNDVSGFEDEDGVGRLLETSYQAAEVTGDVSGIAGFQEVAQAASANW